MIPETIVKSRLRALQVDNYSSLNADSFPGIVLAPYEQLWVEYLQVVAVRQMYKSAPNIATGVYLVAESFISHLSGFDKKVTRTSHDVASNHLSLLTSELQPTCVSVFRDMSRSRLLTQSKVFKHDVEILGQRNELFRGITSPVISGHLAFKPNRRENVQGILNDLKGTIYKAKLPAYLQKPSKYTWGRMKSVKKHPWYLLCKAESRGYSMWMGTTKEGYIVFKYEVPISVPLFYGSEKRSKQAIRNLESRWKSFCAL